MHLIERSHIWCSIGILRPLLVHIFLCDLLLFTTDTDITDCGDENTPHASENIVCKVIEPLEECSGDMFTWFENNGMKANPVK